MTHRDHLEACIIGQLCLLQTAYQQVGDILTENNFQSKIHGIPCSGLFKAVKSLYPDEPIDLLTTTRKYAKNNPNEPYRNVAYAMTEALRNVESTSNLRYHAFQLLQYCIEAEFMIVIANMKSENAVLNQIREQIHHSLKLDNDLFVIIEKAEQFLRQKGFEKEADLVKVLSDKVTKKTQSIRRANQIQSLIANMESVYQIRPEKKEKINDCVIQILQLINEN